MKNLWNILSVLLLLHIIFLVAGGLWLRQSDRLDKNRVKQVIALFTPTLAEDRVKAEELIKAEEESARQKEEAVRLASVSKGPLTAEDRVVTDDQEEELLRQRLQRLDRERQDLLRQIEMAKSALSQQKTQLDEQRTAFDKQVADENPKTQG
ncbi:MAG: hypothetical protein HC898_11295 [Phycisphaerales bacterium]|nr:hypothetical protein [Phycisphaerales bacterium]